MTFSIVKEHQAIKLVLGIRRRKELASAPPLTTMNKAHPPQNDRVKSQTKYKTKNQSRRGVVEVKGMKHIKRRISHIKINLGLEMLSKVIVFLAMNMDIKHLNERIMKRRIQGQMTQ